jgi:hypothetical protein
MARATRHVLYLNPHFGPEKDAIELLNAVPKGEASAFLRAVAVIGREAMLQEEPRGGHAPLQASEHGQPSAGADAASPADEHDQGATHGDD